MPVLDFKYDDSLTERRVPPLTTYHTLQIYLTSKARTPKSLTDKGEVWVGESL